MFEDIAEDDTIGGSLTFPNSLTIPSPMETKIEEPIIEESKIEEPIIEESKVESRGVAEPIIEESKVESREEDEEDVGMENYIAQMMLPVEDDGGVEDDGEDFIKISDDDLIIGGDELKAKFNDLSLRLLCLEFKGVDLFYAYLTMIRMAMFSKENNHEATIKNITKSKEVDISSWNSLDNSKLMDIINTLLSTYGKAKFYYPFLDDDIGGYNYHELCLKPKTLRSSIYLMIVRCIDSMHKTPLTIARTLYVTTKKMRSVYPEAGVEFLFNKSPNMLMEDDNIKNQFMLMMGTYNETLFECINKEFTRL